jgi:hypothetical protein
MDKLRYLLLLLPLGLAGCETSGVFGDKGTAKRVADPTAVAANGGELNPYLEAMGDLIEGDPVTQAEVFQDISQAVEWAPTTTNRLRYALALATPGHPSTDPLAAQSLLNELLASMDTLLPGERILATIHLNEVDQRMLLDSEAERMQRDADNSLQRQSDTTNRQLQNAVAENQRLRGQLKEAQQKLEAITAIERSIQEREGNDDSP